MITTEKCHFIRNAEVNILTASFLLPLLAEKTRREFSYVYSLVTPKDGLI